MHHNFSKTPLTVSNKWTLDTCFCGRLFQDFSVNYTPDATTRNSKIQDISVGKGAHQEPSPDPCLLSCLVFALDSGFARKPRVFCAIDSGFARFWPPNIWFVVALKDGATNLKLGGQKIRASARKICSLIPSTFDRFGDNKFFSTTISTSLDARDAGWYVTDEPMNK